MIQGVLKLMHIVPNDYTLESQFDISMHVNVIVIIFNFITIML